VPCRCPCCGRDLAAGALRCRFCGSDARGAPAEARATIPIENVLTQPQARALALLDELRELAPAVARWLALPGDARGPRPDVRPDRRDRVDHLLAELRLLRERIRPKG
jgi:hypothetical protein